MDELIESNLAVLKNSNLLRSGRSNTVFIDEFSRLLAQAEEDKTDLKNAGFNIELLEMYKAILKKTALAYSKRTSAQTDEKTKKYRVDVLKAKSTKRELSMLIRFLIIKTKNSEIIESYNNIKKNYKHLELLEDNIKMINIIKRNFEIVSQLSPNGKKITKEYLDQLQNEIIDIIALKGIVDTTISEETKSVNKLNRLLTLAVLAEREIKLFAKAAFFNNDNHYKKNYVSPTIRKFHKAS